LIGAQSRVSSSVWRTLSRGNYGWLFAAGPEKLTSQQDWDEFEYQAMQIALSEVVISIPGTGKVDPLLVSQPQWLDLAKRLTDVGMKGVAAAKAKDSAAVSSLGDQQS
jgi:hypothetical protein